MPPIELSTWYVLKECGEEGTKLHLRLLPDHPLADPPEPVIDIRISDTQLSTDNRSQLEALLNSEYVVGLEVNDTHVSVLTEYDDVSLCLSGSGVSVRRRAYSASELQEIFLLFDEQVAASHAKRAALQRHFNEIEEFVIELLRRAEVKRTATSRRTDGLDMQMDVLDRILTKLRSSQT